MSFQKQPTTAKKTQGDAPDKRHVVSLIGLAANLHDPIYHRGIGELYVILEQLESINGTRTQQPRGSRVLRRYMWQVLLKDHHGAWAGGVHTILGVRKNQVGRNANATDKDVVELVRELAKAWPDSYIAGVLNRSGYHTRPGNVSNETRVKNLPLYNKIPVFARG